MEILSKKTFKKVERPIKIMQFGEGNFLRAFIDWFIDEMNKQVDLNANVAVVQPLAFGRVKELEKQDGLYTLIMEGVMNKAVIEKHQVIDVFNDFIDPYTEYDKYLEYAKSEDLKLLISNTTESGIALDTNDIDFTKTPNTFPGKMLALLKARYDYCKGDITKGYFIVACELIDNNGDELKRCLVELSKAKSYDESFINWLVVANKFYNTLVDRIVPGYPADNAKALWEKYGYIDNNMVKGEAFHLWVIEGDEAIKNFLPFEKTNLNILYTNNIKPYKERKVKILNGAHTFMVPIAYQADLRLVGEVMSDERMSNLVGNFIEMEVLPTIKLPKAEIIEFKNSVFDRFSNPFVKHELITISLNSMTKYKTRILPSALGYYEVVNKLPKYALFSLAALFNMYFLKNPDGSALVKDEECFIELYKRLNKQDDQEIVEELLGLSEHWGYDFKLMDGAISFVTDSFIAIKHEGMNAAIKKMLGA